MPGAIIPDDWDETSYQCIKVFWPNSPKWKSLLLGQLTEPENSPFWDETSGDVDLATETIKTAEEATLISTWLEDCPQDMATLPSFKRLRTGTLAIGAGIWTPVPLSTVDIDIGSPGYSDELPAGGHRPFSEDKAGLWRYELLLTIPSSGGIFVSCELGFGGSFVAIAGGTDRALVSWLYDWQGTNGILVPYVFSVNGGTLSANSYNSYFSGSYLGQTV